MPFDATSNNPGLSRIAPVKAPRTCPNSSDSSSVSVKRRTVHRHEGTAGAAALFVDHLDHELLACAAFPEHQHGGVERRHLTGQLEHLLHRRAAGDEVVRFRMLIDALAQQIQFPFAAFEEPLTLGQLLRLASNSARAGAGPPQPGRHLESRRGAVRSRLPHAAASRPITVQRFAPCARHAVSRKYTSCPRQALA